MFMTVQKCFVIDAVLNRCLFCFALVFTVVSCTDPGKVEHSRRVLSGPHLTAGSTIQYVCDKGFILSGNSLLTCFNRGSSGPKWNQKLPRCLRMYSPEPRFTPTYCLPKTYLQIPGEACMYEHKYLYSSVLLSTVAFPAPWYHVWVARNQWGVTTNSQQ